MTVQYDKLIDLTRLDAFKDKCDEAYAASSHTHSYAGSPAAGGNSNQTNAILYGKVDSTSTSTVFTATVDGLDELVDGTTIMLRNGVVTSASGFTLEVNDLGALPVYNNMATGNDITPTAPARDTTIFNINYTMIFTYVASDIVEGGCWICWRGYDGNTNTIGYQLRTNSSTLKASDTGYKYRLWFTSADRTKWVPANTSTSTSATAAKTMNTRPIDPFGPIVYNSTNGTVTANADVPKATIWTVYTLDARYSYMKSGFSLTYPAPVFVKCTPQSNGSAVMSELVQAFPNSNDGKIYIFLGIAYSASSMELRPEHPVYYHDGTAVRLWTGAAASSVSPATATPNMDGTAAVGSSAKYAREDHVHPTDTSRQATLVSGTNIKTVNSTSLLGSGNIAITGLPTVASADNGKVLQVVNGSWAAESPTGGATYSATTVTIATSAWSGTTATVSTAGVTATNDVIVAPAPASISAWAAAGIYCSAQGAGTLTFTCATAPSEAVTANVMVFEGGSTLYTITNAASNNATVDKLAASEGETVTVTNLAGTYSTYFELYRASTYPNGQYAVEYYDSNGIGTFVMPAFDVIVYPKTGPE